MSSVLQINGVDVATPSGITITKEKVWSKNTGRTTSGDMTGDVIAIKTKLQIKWSLLSGKEVAQIESAISPAFFEVYFKDPTSNSYKTKTFYAGTPTYPVYSYVNGYPEYSGIGLDLIEK